MSLAKVCGGDFSRAFLNQIELGRSQPSTRVLRVIAGRLGTEVDYLLEGHQVRLDREIAVEKGRVLVARGEFRRALLAVRPVLDSHDWPLGTDARLCQAEALNALGRGEEAREITRGERSVIKAHRDSHRLGRLTAIERGERFTLEGHPAVAHLRLADRAQRAADGQTALEHYRAARVLLEAGGRRPRAPR